MSDFKVMLAHPYSPKRVQAWSRVFIEPKYDGVRVITLIDKRGRPSYYSRNGRELDMFGHLDSVMADVRSRAVAHARNEYSGDGVMLDGEMIGNKFADIAGAIHRKNHTASDCKYVCFHMMPLDSFEHGRDAKPQIARVRFVNQLIKPVFHDPHLMFADPSQVLKDRIMERHGVHRSLGLEGSMIKNLDAPWVGKRSHDWLKIKDELTADVKCVDIERGKGKYSHTVGALICTYKGKKISVSGMTDDQRDEFWTNPTKVVGRTVEVEYQEETQHGALRHPRFVRVRFDK